MGTLETGKERRRALRAPVHGHAVLHGERNVVGATIVNLSLGGVLVRAREVPGRADGVELELHVPGTTLYLVGVAVRIDRDADGATIAFRFESVSPDAEDAIADAVVGAFAAARRRQVLIVDGVEDRRDDVADALRERGMTPLTPRTPLEVIDLLAAHGSQIELCLVSARFGDHVGLEIADVIRDAFPWVRVLHLRGDGETAAEDAASALDDLVSWSYPAGSVSVVA